MGFEPLFETAEFAFLLCQLLLVRARLHIIFTQITITKVFGFSFKSLLDLHNLYDSFHSFI